MVATIKYSRVVLSNGAEVDASVQLDGDGNIVGIDPSAADVTISGSIATGGAAIQLACNAASSYAISASGTWTGSLLVEGSVDGSIWAGLLVFRAGVGERYTNKITGTGAALSALYRGTDGALAFIRVRPDSDYAATGSVALVLRSGPGSAVVFVGNAIATPEEQAARQGSAFTVSNSQQGMGAANYARVVLVNPSASGRNLMIYRLSSGAGGSNSMRLSRVSNPTNAPTTALTVSPAKVGAAVGVALAYGDMTTTSLSPAPSTSAFALVPSGGITRDATLAPTIVPPGTSVGYQIFNQNALTTADVALTLSWFEEPI